MGQERRRHIRAVSRLTTFIKVIETGRVVRGLTKDLSAVGICVALEGALEAGTPLEVEVALPDRPQPLRFLGEVVWTKVVERPRGKDPRCELGVKFVSIDSNDQSSLMQYAMLNALPPEAP